MYNSRGRLQTEKKKGEEKGRGEREGILIFFSPYGTVRQTILLLRAVWHREVRQKKERESQRTAMMEGRGSGSNKSEVLGGHKKKGHR